MICSSVYELPDTEDYQFFVGVYKDLLQDGEWKIISHRKFENEEDAWAFPQCVIDAITKIGSIYYNVEIIPCYYEECKDLEVVAAWNRHHLVDILMGDYKWIKAIGKPINSNE